MASRRLRRVGLLTGGGDVRGILQLGGTILGTTNRRNPFHYPVRKGKAIVEADRSHEVMRNFKALGLDALIAIGGDGTLGIADRFARKGMKIVRHTGKETRNLVLGHLQRGGQPTSFDRLLGTPFGAAAMRLVAEGRFRTMVALVPPKVLAVPLAKAAGHGRMKKVPLRSDIVQSARDMGIGFGD
jgi:6-phosphofructokinase